MSSMKDVNETIYKIIGSCMEVHKSLGPGYPVEMYKKALAIELAERELTISADVNVDVVYKEKPVGTVQIDFQINQNVIVTLRCQEDLKDIEIQQVLRCLPLANASMGLLVNFGNIKVQYKRILPSRSGRIDGNKNQSLSIGAYRGEMGRTREANPIN